MAGFSTEFLQTLDVVKRGRIRVVRCPKCETELAKQITGSAVTAAEHARMLNHARKCDGTPPEDLEEEPKEPKAPAKDSVARRVRRAVTGS